MDWGNIWNTIVTFFHKNALNLLIFVAILIVGIIVIRVFMSLVRKLLSKTRMEKIAQQFICTILKFVLWLALVLILLAQIGVEITGLLTACSAVILAVGMALQNSIANVANGIIIISNHMFKKGDYIIVDGVEGKISDINFLFTTLITNDNRRITLPNSTILNTNVTNLGAYPLRRVDFTFSVAYESDVEQVKKLITDVMASDGRIYLDPAPFCRLKTLNASSIDFFANCWCDNEDYWDVYYYVVENVYNELKRYNISVPYNQLEIRERKDKVKMPVIAKKLPQRVEKQRTQKHESVKEMFETRKSRHEIRKQKKEKAKEEKRKAKALKAESKTAAKIDNPPQQTVAPTTPEPKSSKPAKKVAAKTTQTTTSKLATKNKPAPKKVNKKTTKASK